MRIRLELEGLEFNSKPKFVKRLSKALKYLNLSEKDLGRFWSKLRYYLKENKIEIMSDNYVRINLKVVINESTIFEGELEVFNKPKISKELRKELKKLHLYGEVLLHTINFKIKV